MPRLPFLPLPGSRSEGERGVCVCVLCCVLWVGSSLFSDWQIHGYPAFPPPPPGGSLAVEE